MKAVIAVLLLATVFAGCTSNDVSVTPPMDAEGRYVVEMTAGLTYSPAQFTVPAGSTVVFVNSGSVWHDVTPDGHSAWAPTGQIDGGEEWVLEVPGPGSYKFYCSPHVANGMKGVMTVTE